jgi:hypothetical protein
MPAVNPSQLADIEATTLADYDRGDWVDLTSKYTSYPFVDAMNDRKRHTMPGGYESRFTVQIANNQNARLSGLYDYARVSQRPLNTQGKVKLAMIRTSYEYDIHEEVFNSGSEHQIVDYFEQKIHSMESQLAEFTEELGWQAPGAPSSNDVYPFLGIPHWFQQGTADAFNPYGGLDPSGWTSLGRAGILTSAVPRHANGTFRYAAVSRLDFVKKIRRASQKCKFMTAKSAKYKNLVKEGGSDFVYYTTSSVVEELEEMLEGKNDNFGMDIGRYMGMTLFKGNPFVPVDYLDDNTTNDPVYGVNYNTIRFATPKGLFQSKSDLITPSDRPTVRVREVYSWVQLQCLELRRNFVGHRKTVT